MGHLSDISQQAHQRPESVHPQLWPPVVCTARGWKLLMEQPGLWWPDLFDTVSSSDYTEQKELFKNSNCTIWKFKFSSLYPNFFLLMHTHKNSVDKLQRLGIWESNNLLAEDIRILEKQNMCYNQTSGLICSFMWGCCKHQLFNTLNSLFRKMTLKCWFSLPLSWNLWQYYNTKRIVESSEKGNTRRKRSERWRSTVSKKEQQGQKENGVEAQLSQRNEQRRGNLTWLQLMDGAGPGGRGSKMCHDILRRDRSLLKQQARWSKGKDPGVQRPYCKA